MRNGNRTRTIGSLTILVVLILPMRNGNYRCIHLYKKLIKTIVLILPMRNGNLLKPSESQEIRNVLILPMRNGNRSYEENNYEKIVVLILPMRNGNKKYITDFKN